MQDLGLPPPPRQLQGLMSVLVRVDILYLFLKFYGPTSRCDSLPHLSFTLFILCLTCLNGEELTATQEFNDEPFGTLELAMRFFTIF